MKDAVSIHNLFKRNSTSFALDVPLLALPAEEITAIVGPNGSGKSTLLQCIAGLQQKTWEGDIKALTRSLRLSRPSDWAQMISWIPQSQSLAFDLKVKDLIVMGLFPWHRGNPSKADLELADYSLRLLNIGHTAERFLSSLSTGEKQMAFLARGLTTKAPILIFDEPCANLDLRASKKFFQILNKQRKDRKQTFIVSLHQLDIAKSYCEFTVVIDKGQIICNGKTSSVLTSNLLMQLYGLEDWEIGGTVSKVTCD